MQIANITAIGPSSTAAWAGGLGNLTLGGNFGGDNAIVEYKKTGTSTWFPLEFVWTRNQGFNVSLPGCDIRVNVEDKADEGSLDLTLDYDLINL